MGQLRGLAIKSRISRTSTLPSRGSRTSRGSIIHNLPSGVRLRESAGAIELLGDASDEAVDRGLEITEERLHLCLFRGEVRGNGIGLTGRVTSHGGPPW